MALEGQKVETAEDAVKDPYVLEFLGLKELPEYSESEFESRIINHLQQFLLELGTGFAFIGRQVQFTFDKEHFMVVDLVFYNRLLRCFVVLLRKHLIFRAKIAVVILVINVYFRVMEASEVRRLQRISCKQVLQEIFDGK